MATGGEAGGPTEDPSDETAFARTVGYPESEAVRIDHAKAQSFLDHCLQVKTPGALADRKAFQPDLLRPWLGNLMILEHLPDTDDFRYRLYGTRIADTSGFDMTGKLVRDFDSPAGRFFASQYHDALIHRRLVFSRHSRLHARYTVDWLRVVCPVATDRGLQIVACNYAVPQNTAAKR